MSRPSEYRADIDGLRGVAVAGVVLFHLQLGLTGGFVGVDVFFVISGFLITRLILQALAEDRFSLRDFWWRRVRRLAPAAATMLIGTLLVGAWMMYPRDFYMLSKSALWQAGLLSNVFFETNLDYFAGPAELHPLLHTWSLAVEEQFYLLYPLLMLGAFRACRRSAPTAPSADVATQTRSRLRHWLVGLAAASLALSIYQAFNDPTKAFFLLPSRSWELLVGALLAAPLHTASNGAMANGDSACGERKPRWLHEALGIAGLSVIGWCFVTYDASMTFPGHTALAPCLATAAVIVAGSGGVTLAGRALQWRPLVGLGLISYSLYLWHWPITCFLHYSYGASLPTGAVASGLAAMLALGYLSWQYIETPFRQRQVPRSAALQFAYGCGLLVLGLSLTSIVTRGLPQRWGPEVVQMLENSRHSIRAFRTGAPEQARHDELPRIGDPAQTPTVLFWGDSHAGAIGHACDEFARRHGIAGYVACRGGTIPLLDTYRPKNQRKVVPWNAAVLDFVRRQRIQHVVLVCRWAGNITPTDTGLNESLIMDDKVEELNPHAARETLLRGLQRTVAALEQEGARVWIMKQIPQQEANPFRSLIKQIRDGVPTPTGVSRSEHLARQQPVTDVFATLPSVRFLDPADYVFDASGKSRLGTAKHCFYADYHHLSQPGARELLAPMLDDFFNELERTSHAAGMVRQAQYTEPASAKR
ncbi:MAG: acyltransferase [Planctomycetales bacterium]|nr:acyltransferase [Planctomycetales bacterium]